MCAKGFASHCDELCVTWWYSITFFSSRSRVPNLSTSWRSSEESRAVTILLSRMSVSKLTRVDHYCSSFLYWQKIIIIIFKKTIFWANNLRPRGVHWLKDIYKIRETFCILKDANAHSLFYCTSPCQVPRCWVLSAEINLLFLHVLVIAVLEAEDIDLHLRPLRRLISNLEERSFPKVDALLPALFHTLCLIWSRSQHYCTPQRIVVLLQEFCNLIVDKV